MRHYKRILCPVDFSSFAKAALAEGAELAQSLGSQLCVLHAYQNPAYLLPMAGYVGPAGDVVAQVRKQLGEELDELVTEYRARGLKIQTLVLEGVPYKTIVDYATEWGADLIAMGTHGRTGLSHMLAGSVTERVVRLARCSVLVARAPQGATA
jgi:nucleotide-binding universal stress UspA family protein